MAGRTNVGTEGLGMILYAPALENPNLVSV